MNDTIIVKQIQKDLKKLKEVLLQNQFDKENDPLPLTAEDEQLQIEIDFEEAVANLKKVSNCFWRFSDVEPVFNEAIKTFR